MERKRDLGIWTEDRSCHAAEMKSGCLHNSLLRLQGGEAVCNKLQVAAFQISRARIDLAPSLRLPCLKAQVTGAWGITMRKEQSPPL